jgi:hypothetical protein
MPAHKREDRSTILDQRLVVLINRAQRTELDRAARDADASIGEVVRERLFGPKGEEGRTNANNHLRRRTNGVVSGRTG